MRSGFNLIFSTMLMLAFLMCCTSKTKNAVSVVSPDGKVNVNFTIQDGMPYYSVSYDAKIVIQPSRLGFRFKSATPMEKKLSIIENSQKNSKKLLLHSYEMFFHVLKPIIVLFFQSSGENMSAEKQPLTHNIAMVSVVNGFIIFASFPFKKRILNKNILCKKMKKT